MLQKVLIVDASRVARASLARYLKGHFKVCEDVDGESAWQTLVLDNSVVAVIAGGHLERLDTLPMGFLLRKSSQPVGVVFPVLSPRVCQRLIWTT